MAAVDAVFAGKSRLAVLLAQFGRIKDTREPWRVVHPLRSAGGQEPAPAKAGAKQPTLQAEVEAFFADAPAESLARETDVDKGHGRIETRTVTVAHEVDWLSGDRRFPGELRLPAVASLVRIEARAELKDRSRFETRYYISSAALTPARALEAVRGHWGIENRLHWVLDTGFGEDLCRLRKGHGARNMAVVRHFAINLLRTAKDRKSLRLRRKVAGWDTKYLAQLLHAPCR